MSTTMTAKIAIQTTQVRGGTLNSPGLRGFLSSPLFLLLSGIVKLAAQSLAPAVLSRNLAY
jgi:hypothetical protein